MQRPRVYTDILLIVIPQRMVCGPTRMGSGLTIVIPPSSPVVVRNLNVLEGVPTPGVKKPVLDFENAERNMLPETRDRRHYFAQPGQHLNALVVKNIQINVYICSY